MKQLTVMVTGAGAVLGQGVLRCLRMAQRPIRVITADPDYRAAGHWLGDFAVTIPMADDPEYLKAVEIILAREQVGILLIGTDVELPIFSKERVHLEAKYGTRVVVSSPRVVEIANDKLMTAHFLEGAGFSFALSVSADDRSAIAELAKTIGFPLIAKPKQGARSVGVFVVNSPEELSHVMGRTDLVVQELLPGNEGEYTAGCLVVQKKCLASVMLRRDLRDGNTYRAYADTSRRFDGEISAIAERLGCYGPCNFQFRIKNGRPVVFEINARFSGTTPIRAMFGFNEVLAIVDYLNTDTPIPEVKIKEGAVFRAWSDIYVDALQLENFKITKSLSAPNCTEYPFRSL
ncbi:MAG: ATP-grasp domain-containing protein [Deltaproteobacteria bacterium]|nr:ATP-grasp domain-containing protein [Deltaproteobacteria bacterium]